MAVIIGAIGPYYYGSSLKVFSIVCYSISIISAFLTICVMLVNLLGHVSEFLSNVTRPLRKPRVILVTSCALSIFVWQILLLLQINHLEILQTKEWLSLIIAVSILFFSMVFYFCCLAYFLVLFVLIKYYAEVFDIKRWWIYSIAYISPVVYTAIVILVGYSSQSQHFSWLIFYSKPAKWTILAMQTFITMLSLLIVICVLYDCLKSCNGLDFSVMDILKTLKNSSKLINGFLLVITLLILFVMDIISSSQLYISDVMTGVYITFHSFLGIFFLIFEALYYDKDFRKPFRFQRQRAASKLNHFKKNDSSSNEQRKKDVEMKDVINQYL